VIETSVPRPTLRRRTFTIELKATMPTSEDGYDVRTTGQIALTFRRGAITSEVQSF
jgi:hypothetical protein